MEAITDAVKQVSLVDVRKALADHRTHAYEKFYVVWGRKPEAKGDRRHGSHT